METAKARRPDLSQYPDEELVALVRRGDSEAFRAIMQRYNRRLYRVARGVVRDDGEAEEVVQEAYMRAYAALEAFRGESGLATWLTRIVLNEALGRLRRRRPTEELDEMRVGIMEKAVCVRLNLEVMNQPKRFALEDSQVSIEAGHIQFVELTAQE